jgi:predicted phage-related endonuclease
MKVINVEQGTQEWHAQRRCKVTGTKLDDVMGTSLARTQLIAELIAEEATEQTKQIKVTEAMERGNAEEIFALKLFAKQTGKKVEQGGFWLSDEYDYLACSPDGTIVSENGDILEAVEVKNPDSQTAIFYRLTNMVGMEALGLGTYSAVTKNKPESVFKPSAKNPFLGIPPEYKWQCVNYFLVNRKLQKLHFVVHDARFINDSQKLYVVTVERSNPDLIQAIAEVEIELQKFRTDWMNWKDIVLPLEI